MNSVSAPVRIDSDPAAPHPPSTPAPTGPEAGVLIPVRTERQAMDWSLALLSQHIACVIRPPAQPGLPWGLEVDPVHTGPALRTLRLYHVENRGWRGAFTTSTGGLPFHWAVLPWCLLMLVVAGAASAPDSLLGARGAFATATTRSGEWWRPLTATFLHSGVDHLAANLATGFVLLGLAFARFGAGFGLLGTLTAGVAGNLFAWVFRGHDYTGLGSSGVVMGALGMLTVSLFSDARSHRIAPSTAVRGLLGGVALFILLGTSPNSDVLAHAGGFVSGLLLAAFLSLVPAEWPGRARADAFCGVLYFLLCAAGWLVALR